MVLAVLFALGQGHVEGLGADDAAVHVGDGLGGLFGRAEADEAEALGAAVLAHDLGRGDGAEGGELFAEALVVYGVVQVLDVEVDADVAILALLLLLLVHLLEVGAALDLLLEAADKMPVGKHDKEKQSFTQHTVSIETGDVVYAITDGMPDQFGGPKGKKFMYKQLKELLISIAHLPMNKQKEKLAITLDHWKGNLEQVDDITIIGIRI